MRKVNGFTTLTVSLLLVSILVAVSAFIGKVLVSDKRIALNEIEYRVAFAAAEKGIAEAIAELKVDSAATAVSGSVASSSAQATYNVTMAANGATPGVTDIVSTATMDNGAQTRISVQVAESSVLNPNNSGPAAPLIISGTTPLNGNITIVANPNGSGKGVPVSVWSKNAVNISGSALTCGLDEYTNGGCTTNNAYSYKQGASTVINSDIVANDPGFPSDMFDYVFGEPDSAGAWKNINAKATAIISSCTDPQLTGGAGFFIIEGAASCAFDSIGSASAPVILLVKDSSVVMNANSKFYGLLFSYDSNPSDASSYNIKVNGGAEFYGSLLANHDSVTLANGNFGFIYSEDIICDFSGCDSSSLGSGSSNPFISLGVIPGSWKDW
ncbi:pilus assembly PilX N-terminal domain-containing protein [Zobellella maritima]|uniref:pilus assembly PilX N-terminal domain-containing protein n=1 Tax=Zobellella maritima TaxID=2059725 RepID=UPI000E301121|nr:pilus assembly PilX N-terminal domain-containing protein [Zobellella maritima]